MKVMICEQNPEKAKVLRDLLNSYKFKLITVTEGGDFFKQVQTHKPAVIILKEKFAGKSPSHTFNRLRSNPVSSKIPVIFISEDNKIGGELQDLLQDSLLEHIREPYRIKHLRHFVDRWTIFRSLHVKQ